MYIHTEMITMANTAAYNVERLLFVAITSAIYTIVYSQCPSKSVFTNNKCYLLIATDEDWFGAEIKCQQLFHRNGHLAAIENSFENTAVIGIIFYIANNQPQMIHNQCKISIRFR